MHDHAWPIPWQELIAELNEAEADAVSDRETILVGAMALVGNALDVRVVCSAEPPPVTLLRQSSHIAPTELHLSSPLGHVWLRLRLPSLEPVPEIALSVLGLVGVTVENGQVFLRHEGLLQQLFYLALSRATLSDRSPFDPNAPIVPAAELIGALTLRRERFAPTLALSRHIERWALDRYLGQMGWWDLTTPLSHAVLAPVRWPGKPPGSGKVRTNPPVPRRLEAIVQAYRGQGLSDDEIRDRFVRWLASRSGPHEATPPLDVIETVVGSDLLRTYGHHRRALHQYRTKLWWRVIGKPGPPSLSIEQFARLGDLGLWRASDAAWFAEEVRQLLRDKPVYWVFSLLWKLWPVCPIFTREMQGYFPKQHDAVVALIVRLAPPGSVSEEALRALPPPP
ncbi:hypothetical protein HY375_04000 [Candidatus Berkelbacteria bacterium]|nr:hypothetical protein [Candidatus Berkelbacteria bacterium]